MALFLIAQRTIRHEAPDFTREGYLTIPRREPGASGLKRYGTAAVANCSIGPRNCPAPDETTKPNRRKTDGIHGSCLCLALSSLVNGVRIFKPCSATSTFSRGESPGRPTSSVARVARKERVVFDFCCLSKNTPEIKREKKERETRRNPLVPRRGAQISVKSVSSALTTSQSYRFDSHPCTWNRSGRGRSRSARNRLRSTPRCRCCIAQKRAREVAQVASCGAGVTGRKN